jgi:hypothetical protein
MVLCVIIARERASAFSGIRRPSEGFYFAIFSLLSHVFFCVGGAGEERRSGRGSRRGVGFLFFPSLPAFVLSNLGTPFGRKKSRSGEHWEIYPSPVSPGPAAPRHHPPRGNKNKRKKWEEKGCAIRGGEVAVVAPGGADPTTSRRYPRKDRITATTPTIRIMIPPTRRASRELFLSLSFSLSLALVISPPPIEGIHFVTSLYNKHIYLTFPDFSPFFIDIPSTTQPHQDR